MAEYISKEAVNNLIEDMQNNRLLLVCERTNLYILKSKVAELPAADVQPVKHGRWIGIYEYCEKNGCIPSGMGICYWCSECDKAEQKTSDFCPNCGARMDGDTECQ